MRYIGCQGSCHLQRRSLVKQMDLRSGTGAHAPLRMPPSLTVRNFKAVRIHIVVARSSAGHGLVGSWKSHRSKARTPIQSQEYSDLRVHLISIVVQKYMRSSKFHSILLVVLRHQPKYPMGRLAMARHTPIPCVYPQDAGARR
jgi:hypothetical protein